ncbi:MAG: DUF892 family protein [Flavobacteriales bacterium]|nr:MAG: DUF892 family protein [Flavobacteriales bacterium]
MIQEYFLNALMALLQAEKQCLTHYKKMANKGVNAALIKALHPQQTFCPEHVKRLKLIASMLPKTSFKKSESAMPINLPKFAKRSASLTDLAILVNAVECESVLLAHYKMLKIICHSLLPDPAPELLAQSIAEHRQTSKWLRQLLQESILPPFLTNQ